MFNTYIKNKGKMKTIIHKNHHNKVREVEWDADYDGNKANINIDLNNGHHDKHYQLQLDNDNLAELLNIPSVNMPLEKRLLRDFKKSRKSYHNNEPIKPIYIEFDIPTPEPKPVPEPYFLNPYENQQIIIPVQRKTITRRYKRHKKPKTYRIYYKRAKTSPSRKYRRSSRVSRASRGSRASL